MWVAQSFRLSKGQRMLISGGMGSMGFSLPAAIGAAMASPKSRVLIVSGDGGIQINIQDMDTIVKHNLNIKIFVLNNGCLGMVRQFQDLYFDGRRQSTVIGYSCPDLIGIAEAYGMRSFLISKTSEVAEKIKKTINSIGPAFVNVALEQGTMVNPKLVVGRPIEDMSPHMSREELKNIMIVKPVNQRQDHK